MTMVILRALLFLIRMTIVAGILWFLWKDYQFTYHEYLPVVEKAAKANDSDGLNVLIGLWVAAHFVILIILVIIQLIFFRDKPEYDPFSTDGFGDPLRRYR
jgi:Na+/H+-translocating membrane pyrophosphatase